MTVGSNDKRIPSGITGDLMLAYGVAMWCAGYAIGYSIGCIRRLQISGRIQGFTKRRAP
jgi:hypothetical protein